MPTEPLPSQFDLSMIDTTVDSDVVAVGADLESGTILQAYRRGFFPMGLGENGAPPLGWWSPDPRGVLHPAQLHVSRSLRVSQRRFEVRVDTAFAEVVTACADPTREARWITDEVGAAYLRLHELGWAHSVETYADGELVGGLYGMCLGGLFAGESMFHRRNDASKVALAALADILTADGVSGRLIDVQWATDHLRSLGAVDMPRQAYLAGLPALLRLPSPPQFS